MNEIGRATLCDYLSTKLPPGTKRVRFSRDNCPGQKKSSPVIVKLSHFSARTRIIIEYFFPVRGHSYLPADRTFGRVEKKLRMHETMLLPTDYFKVFQSVGKFRLFPTEWSIYDFEAFARDIFESKQKFLISEQHRVEISGTRVMASPNFCDAYKEFSFLKRGNNLNSFSASDRKCLPMNRQRSKTLYVTEPHRVSENHPAYEFYRESCAPNQEEENETSTEEGE